MGSNENLVVLNEETMLSLFGNDRALHEEVLKEFMESCCGYREEFCQAWQQRDAAALKAVAHKLKSSSLTIGAEQLASVCSAIEVAAKGQIWDELELHYPNLEPAIACVGQVISAR